MAEYKPTVALAKEDFETNFKDGTRKFLGRGFYGVVKECVWKEELAVVKVIHLQECSKRKESDHIEETCIEWSKLNHENIIQFYGIHFKIDRALIVMEKAQGGTLKDKVTDEISTGQYIKWVTQIATALAYMHDKKKVHRDLKWDNILLDKDENIKICDFDYLRDETSSMSSGGWIGITAPELWRGNFRKTSKCDIWSFGIVQLYMVIGENPMPHPNVFAAEGKNWRPEIPNWCPKEIKSIISNCWKEDPEKRLTAQELVEDYERVRRGFIDHLDIPIRKLFIRKPFLKDVEINLLSEAADEASNTKIKNENGNGNINKNNVPVVETIYDIFDYSDGVDDCDDYDDDRYDIDGDYDEYDDDNYYEYDDDNYDEYDDDNY